VGDTLKEPPINRGLRLGCNQLCHKWHSFQKVLGVAKLVSRLVGAEME